MPNNSQENALAVSSINDHLGIAKSRRVKWLVEAFYNMHFIEGNHQIYWNTVTRVIESKLIEKDSEEAVVVDKARSMLRGLKNLITRNDPRWYVKNSESVEASPEEKDAANNYLSSKYRTQNMKDKIKDILEYSLLRTWCVASCLYKKNICDTEVDVYDPLDCYPDPTSTEPKSWGFFVLTMPRLKSDLLRDKTFKDYWEAIEKVTTDRKTSETEVKDSFNKMQGESKSETVILKMDFTVIADPSESTGEKLSDQEKTMNDAYKKSDVAAAAELKKEAGPDTPEPGDTADATPDDTQKEQPKEKTKTRVRIRCCIGDTLIQDELLPDTIENLADIFSIYFAERRAGQLYFTAWMTPVIRLNKLLDRNFANVDEYDSLINKGRWIQLQGSKMSTISSKKNGQVIKYQGAKPEALQVPQLSQTTFLHQDRIKAAMEDLGGIHGESMGRQSGDANSGRALALLAAGDENNAAEPVANLETFMANLGRIMLKCASAYYTEVRKFYYDDESKEEEVGVPVIGSAYSDKLDQAGVSLGKEQRSNATKLKPFDNLRVEIIPSSAFSDMYAFNALMQLKKANVKVPDSALLEAAKQGNVRELIRKWETENAAAPQDPDVMIAEGVVRKMLTEGVQMLPNPNDDVKVHLAVVGAALQAVGPNDPHAELLMNYAHALEAMSGNAPQDGGPGGGPVPPPPGGAPPVNPGGPPVPPPAAGAPPAGAPDIAAMMAASSGGGGAPPA